VEKKLTEFFIVDDDVIIEERNLDDLEHLTKVMNYPAGFFASKLMDGWSWEVDHAISPILLDFRPLFVRLYKEVNLDDFKSLKNDSGDGWGYPKFASILAGYLKRAIMIKRQELCPYHLNFSYEEKVWMKEWNQKNDVDLRIGKLIEQYAPDYRVDMYD
jgi:hypothetical protein